MDGLLRLPPQPLTPRQARHAIRRVCEVGGVKEDREETAALLVSELTTNAVRHAGTDVEIAWSLGPSLHIEVRDFGQGVPALQEIDEVRETGRGLWLVNALADRWGIDLQPDEKRVWFEVDLPD